MTHREEWVEKSFQVFTDEDGVLRSGYYPTGEGIVTGNVQVDRVWGNIPMQPNDDRTDTYINFGGGSGDAGWDNTFTYTSDTLQYGTYENNDAVQWLFNINPEISTDHVNVNLGYSNFPGYIPNYAGDEDSGLEAVVPNVLRMTRSQAIAAIEAVNLDYRIRYHNSAINYLESTGTTVRVFAYDTDAEGGGSAQAYLVGLKVGDKVYPDNNEVDFGTSPVTVTAVNEDGEDSWFEFEVAEAFDPALDTTADGTVWPGPDLEDVITVMRYWNQPGDIKDEGTNIYLRAIGTP